MYSLLLSWIIVTLVANVVDGRPPTKIIGPSYEVCSGQRSYQVSLWGKFLLPNSMLFFCGGTVLDEKHILTAAHCVSNVAFSGISVVAGCSDLFDVNKTVSTVARVDVHRQYDRVEVDNTSFLVNDIAVLTIFPPLRLGRSIKAIKLPNDDVKAQMVGEVAGWGSRVPENITDLSRFLLYTKMEVLEPENCGRFIPSTQFCAIDRRRMTTVGGGDSGSPFVMEKTVVGIVSSGRRSAQLPSYFTNIFPYVDFIKDIVRSTAYDDNGFGYVVDEGNIPLVNGFVNRH